MKRIYSYCAGEKATSNQHRSGEVRKKADWTEKIIGRRYPSLRAGSYLNLAQRKCTRELQNRRAHKGQ